MKIQTFSITSKSGQILNWSLSLLLVFSVFNLIDGWASAPIDEKGVLSEAFATLQGNDFIRAIEYFMIAATKLTMFEVFRRCLNKAGHKVAQFTLTILMALIFSLAMADILPMFLFSSLERVQSLIHGGCPSLFYSFSKVTYVVLVITQFVLSLQLVKNFAGKIRLFGTAFFGCQVITWLANLAYLFIYTSVAGVSMDDIMTYSKMVDVFGSAVSLIPYFLLRTTMVAED